MSDLQRYSLAITVAGKPAMSMKTQWGEWCKSLDVEPLERQISALQEVIKGYERDIEEDT